MPRNQPKYLPLSSEQNAELQNFISRGDGYYHINADDIPSAIPTGLREKWDSAAVVVSRSTTSNGAFALVGHRIDAKVGKMDQDPFVIAVSGSAPIGNGVLVHHADFPSRSIDIPAEYWDQLGSSGLMNYYAGNPPYGVSSGSTEQVPDALVKALNIGRQLLDSFRTS